MIIVKNSERICHIMNGNHGYLNWNVVDHVVDNPVYWTLVARGASAFKTIFFLAKKNSCH